MNKNFCPAPWINISTDVNGSIRPCCRYSQPGRQLGHKTPNMKDGNLNDVWNSDKMQTIRQAMIDGKKLPECNWCWSEEATGQNSFRERYLNDVKSYNIEVDFESVIAPPPAVMDLKLTNVCNLKCRMCGPTASSSILKEQKRLGKKFGTDEVYWLKNKIIGTENEDLFFNEWVPNMKSLELTGGEPFVSLENKKLIAKIVESGHSEHIDILITTNGTHYSKKLMNDVESFKYANLSISIDDFGPRLEYARSGANWDLIKSNILKFKTHDVKLKAYVTVNNYNIWHLKEIESEFSDIGLPIVYGFLHEPEALSIKYLNSHIKEKIVEKYSDGNKRFSFILDFLNASEDDHTINLYRHIREHDEMRTENFDETFEEWAEVIMYV